MTSLPILWAEEADIGAMLQKRDAPPHWARTVIEARGKLFALDRIANETMRGVDIAVLAQPRPFAPEEMVALDRWVRGGGRLLLFADPMLTAHSAYPIGDKRRPQAIAMIDPLLAHWGMELQFDDATVAGERAVESEGIAIPVNLPGKLKVTARNCRADAEHLVARCRIGLGVAVVIADAELLEFAEGSGLEARISALNRLIDLVEIPR